MNIDINKYPIKWFKQLDDNDCLIINSNYQRRGVWLQKDKVRLIESILMNLPIPEIYVWQKDTNADTGETRYEIVDGQQRLHSVLEFIGNPNFKLNSRYLEIKESSFANKTFEELGIEDKQLFWRYQFVVRSIPSEVTEEEIAKLFYRLNATSYSLNPQELRNAEFNGEFIQLAEELSRLDFWKKFNIFNMNDIRRMLDIQTCSSILIFLRSGIQSESQALINRIYDRYNDEYPEKEDDRETFIALVQIVEQFLEVNNLFAQKKTQLYTLFNIAYWILSKKGIVSKEELERFDEFCVYYNLSEEKLEEQEINAEYIEAVILFRSASLEGTASKSQRERRFFTLKKILTNEIRSRL
ncbi:DUF262 domain-containing protein [Peribacillus frigoritolerans]|uniref:DUF262 domain-containing protein n=1 Tax=Peribacillus frigoritolerans TaxID=450367 RepID=UPI0025A299D7|nr:DUF262 domain-containing protein [Peribacillus frigoritolerans]MDM5305815.1 DUF262 domain-containing protein [Peribacillus frigoritolerans]